ncbi:glucose-1-phosphate adenylyltransferase [candidate division KSB1 bacterium]|nr:glucose-1-phosphate adenylyltransferase [candidate division KSB1 bacterium]RQW04140.1 MAG: glucose-1-phosphate adenylyltransferase [candidate division KSB1 bacterium]
MRTVLAIILGGGRGSRLYPLTKLRAKPAVPIAGKYRLIDIPVSNCINSGIQKIYVLTQFNSASLNRHISLTYNFGPFSEGFVEVLAAQQTPDSEAWFQGTADAVRRVLNYVQNYNVTEYLVLSGDHLYRMNYRSFIDSHRAEDADLTIPVIAVDEEHASSFGLIKIDEKNNVVEFREKPTGAGLKEMAVDTTNLGLDEKEAERRPYIASMGIYAFKRHVMPELLDRDHKQSDFGREVIPAALNDLKVKTYLFNDYWEDIGTIDAFYDANMALVKFPKPLFSFYHPEAPIYTRQRFLPPCKFVNSDIVESMIAEGCIINKAKIQKSILGVRTYIEEGCEIQESLIMGRDFFQSLKERENDVDEGKIPTGIGKNTIIKKAIIDKNARIGRNVKIINKNGEYDDASHEKEGWYIRDGIVVVLKNAIIPDGTEI